MPASTLAVSGYSDHILDLWGICHDFASCADRHSLSHVEWTASQLRKMKIDPIGEESAVLEMSPIKIEIGGLCCEKSFYFSVEFGTHKDAIMGPKHIVPVLIFVAPAQASPVNFCRMMWSKARPWTDKGLQPIPKLETLGHLTYVYV